MLKVTILPIFSFFFKYYNLFLFCKDKSLSSSSTESSRRLEQFPMNFFSFFCLSRVIANIYKDVIKCKRNKK